MRGEGLPVEERLLLALERLIELMTQNERDRELSPQWRHHDGSPMTRKETEALGVPFEGPEP